MCEVDGGSRKADIPTLYRETVSPLYEYVSRRVAANRSLCEDITQETYLRAVHAWRDGNIPNAPLAWLKTVARNLIVNHYRRRLPGSLDSVRLDRFIEGQTIDDVDAAALVYWGLARLPRRHSALLERFHIDGKQTREIAAESGISERAVEGRLRRARKALRKQLESYIEEEKMS